MRNQFNQSNHYLILSNQIITQIVGLPRILLKNEGFSDFGERYLGINSS